MSYTKIQKQLLIGTVALAVLIINIFMVFTPKVQEIGLLRKTFNANASKIGNLKNAETQKEELIKKEKFYKSEFVGMNERLPNYLVPEKFITSLKEFAFDNKLSISNLTFTKPSEFTVSDINPGYNPTSPLSARADELITGFFAGDDINGVRATANELQFAGIGEEKPIKIDIDFKFNGPYDSTKAFIKALEGNLSNVSVNSITMQPEMNGGKISGNMIVSLFGFKDSKIPVYDLWTPEFEKGKANLFGKGGTRYNVDDSDVSDFDIALNTYASDAPTIIMRKHGNYNSAVYGDSKGIEKVELQISEKNGKTSFRYKTATTSYPIGYTYTEFQPVTSKGLVIKVYSRPRAGESDNAGMDLTIYNHTGRDVKVLTYNDDKVKPRVNYEVR